MKKTNIKIVYTDVHGNYLRDISIWTLIGNKTAVDKLKILINEFHNNKSESRKQKIKNILLCGKNGSGKTVLAHAYSNSLCCSTCFEADGATLSLGGQGISQFLQSGDNSSSYLIHNAEKLSSYCIHILNTAMRTKILIDYDYIEGIYKRHYFNKLLMLTCSDISKVNPQLVKNIDVCLNLNGDLTEEETQGILEQRISYLSWTVNEKEKFIKSIVDIVGGDISKAIEILGWSHSCARDKGEDVITLKHLNRALHLLQ